MIRMVRNVAATLAVASLVVAQPALATRSSDSLPSAGAKVTSQAQRVGSKVGTAEDLHGSNGFIIGSIALVVVVALILAATNGKHDGNSSPG